VGCEWSYHAGITEYDLKYIHERIIKMSRKMKGAILPGNSTVELKEFDIPVPGHGEVLIKIKSSTICGSDIRCIYHEHLGKGPEGYQPGLIAGHEPCGQIAETGPGSRRFKKNDRVIIYHISGCGLCNDCRRGYMISCTSEKYRRAYGWQRDGGMAEYMLAEEKDLVLLPDELSYSDGAQVACGFGTVYEGLEKIGICGNDAVLITGLGPVGLASAMLCKAMGAQKIIGTEAIDERIKIAEVTGLFDSVLKAGPDNVEQVRALTGGMGVERAVDCSANNKARLTCIQAARKWGKIVFLGEGGTCEFQPSPDIIHDQKTIYGSWVTNIWRMEELVERLVRWGIHPERLITHRFSLDKAGEAYALMASGKCGKVAVVFDEEIK
jgi:threonine dehydrogenase-like Zn-dependent dehydrogenase